MDDWPTIPVSFNLPRKPVQGHTQPSFDPYQMMIKRNQSNDESSNNTDKFFNYNENDVYELEQFCKEHNILGFNCGRMNPKSALNMLRSKLGIKTENIINKKILHG